MNTKILFDTYDITQDKFKEYIKAAYSLGRLNKESEFDDICEFVDIKPSEIVNRFMEEAIMKNNVDIITKFINGENE